MKRNLLSVMFFIVIFLIATLGHARTAGAGRMSVVAFLPPSENVFSGFFELHLHRLLRDRAIHFRLFRNNGRKPPQEFIDGEWTVVILAGLGPHKTIDYLEEISAIRSAEGAFFFLVNNDLPSGFPLTENISMIEPDWEEGVRSVIGYLTGVISPGKIQLVYSESLPSSAFTTFLRDALQIMGYEFHISTASSISPDETLLFMAADETAAMNLYQAGVSVPIIALESSPRLLSMVYHQEIEALLEWPSSRFADKVVQDIMVLPEGIPTSRNFIAPRFITRQNIRESDSWEILSRCPVCR